MTSFKNLADSHRPISYLISINLPEIWGREKFFKLEKISNSSSLKAIKEIGEREERGGREDGERERGD